MRLLLQDLLPEDSRPALPGGAGSGRVPASARRARVSQRRGRPGLPGARPGPAAGSLPASGPCQPNIFQPVPGQPGQSGLIFNPYFRLTQQMLPKGLRRRVLGSPPSCGVHCWGQAGEG